MDNTLTVEEAAKILGCHPDMIRKLCRAGTIECEKFSNVWMVDRSSVEDYKTRPRHKPGPKPKKKPDP